MFFDTFVSTDTLVVSPSGRTTAQLCFPTQGADSMKYGRSIHSVGILMLVGAMAACATRNACTGSACTPDEAATAAVNARFARHAELGAPGEIQVSTIDHVVYLTGTTSTEYQRSIAESLAAKAPGVTRVVDWIGTSN
jgi:hypothetical protein